MVRIVYRFGLGVLGVFFYLQDNTFWVVCAVLLAWSFLQQQIAAIVGILRKLVNVPHEHEANSVLHYTFSVERVVEHPSVDALFNRLRNNGKAPANTLEEWRTLLLRSYARKYSPATTACEVRFNIKNNLLFLNGDVNFGDYIYHELEIPYRWGTDDDPVKTTFLQPNCEVELSIRILVVNGSLLLQIGCFDKDYSPRILHAGGLAVYETYATVTSFPLRTECLPSSCSYAWTRRARSWLADDRATPDRTWASVWYQRERPRVAFRSLPSLHSRRCAPASSTVRQARRGSVSRSRAHSIAVR